MNNSKYQEWWDSLSPQMQEHLKNQPLWYDRDLVKVGVIFFIIGLLIGLVI